MESTQVSRLVVDCSAVGFEAVITSLLAIACFTLWRRRGRGYFLGWGLAWTAYALRLATMSSYLVHRAPALLAAHEALAGVTSLLLLFAALQFSRGARWRPAWLVLYALAIVWGWASIYVVRDMVLAGVVSILLLAGVTIWTGVVFWRHRARARSRAAAVLAWTFWLWGLHHVDYPLLRGFGEGVLYGMMADVLFIVMTALGTLFLVLGDERRALADRQRQLEQLTRLLLRAQEDERRRVAGELHDEAERSLGELRTELELDGRAEAGSRVARVLERLRAIRDELRPPALDGLGLVPALRSLVDDFARRTRTAATLETAGAARAFPPDVAVALYRVAQESLDRVARRGGARRVDLRLDVGDDAVVLVVRDDGGEPGSAGTPDPALLFMRERVSDLGGAFDAGAEADAAGARGFRVRAAIPLADAD